MHIENFISEIMQIADRHDNVKQLRGIIPLGLDMAGEIVTARKHTASVMLKHTCITGNMREECICNLLITLSCLYEKEEASFVILSPNQKYVGLLSLLNMNVVVPYVRTKEEWEAMQPGLRDLINMHSRAGGYPYLVLVVDGIEDVLGCNVNEELKEYYALFDRMRGRANMEIITGVDLMKSIYSGCPGAFVGIGNCLVTTREDGKADVTYVDGDTNLSLPILIDFPCEPSVAETVQTLNKIYKGSVSEADAELKKADDEKGEDSDN